MKSAQTDLPSSLPSAVSPQVSSSHTQSCVSPVNMACVSQSVSQSSAFVIIICRHARSSVHYVEYIHLQIHGSYLYSFSSQTEVERLDFPEPSGSFALVEVSVDVKILLELVE